MNGNFFPLSLAVPGKKVTLVSINGGRGLRARLTNMGLKVGMQIEVMHSYRAGPCIVFAENTRLVLGHGMADKIFVKEEQT